MRFEWDENKRRSNLKKHGLDFVDAATMLSSATCIFEDTRYEYGEIRCHAFSELNGFVFIIIFTVRQGAFRIISARRANARERMHYERLTHEPHN